MHVVLLADPSMPCTVTCFDDLAITGLSGVFSRDLASVGWPAVSTHETCD
jgi:hypothetical protein